MGGVILFFILLNSCHQLEIATISEKNLIQKSFNLDPDGLIFEAEQKLGKLYKEERIFVDSSSGSSITLLFAAINKKSLEDYFNTMDLTFFGLSKQELKELRNGSNNKQISLENSSTNNSDFNFDIDEQEVFYDLIDKNIKGEDVGYKFSVMPKKDLNKAARIKSKKWKQQTSLPWCEWAIFRTDFVPVFPGSTTPKTITIYYQTRGLIWGGSGTIPQPFQLNGNIWDMWIDGPKYTRFGIDNNYDGDTFYNWGVLWVSVDEPDEVSDNFY